MNRVTLALAAAGSRAVRAGRWLTVVVPPLRWVTALWRPRGVRSRHEADPLALEEVLAFMGLADSWRDRAGQRRAARAEAAHWAATEADR